MSHIYAYTLLQLCAHTQLNRYYRPARMRNRTPPKRKHLKFCFSRFKANSTIDHVLKYIEGKSITAFSSTYSKTDWKNVS